MTGSQYKNIIQYTLLLNKDLEKDAPLDVVRVMMNNLGVSLPNGGIKDILKVLNRKDYMGWRPIAIESSQFYANIGVPVIVITDDNIIVISPDSKVGNLSDICEVNNIKNDNVKNFDQLLTNKSSNMLCFAYNYGRELDKEKSK